jgi:hypothetical protein
MAGLGVFFWLSFLNVYKYAQRKPHTGPLAELEHRRAFLAAELSRLGDLRPGSSTSIVAVAASPTVIALSPTIPGHAPTLRLASRFKARPSGKPYDTGFRA